MDGKKELSGFKDKRILVVDDYDPNSLLNKIYLTSEGIDSENVVVVSNSRDAIERAEHELFDVIIMVISPGINGVSATQEIKEYYATGSAPQIIAYTVNSNKDNVEKYEKIFDDIMIKPVKRTSFIQKIFDVLTRQNAKNMSA